MMSEELNRSRRLIAQAQRSAKAEELLELLPQGHGSGLDADMVDGKHAVELIAMGRGGSTGSSGGGGNIIEFASFTLFKERSGIIMINVGVEYVELLDVDDRLKVDLSAYQQCRVLMGGYNSEAVLFYCKIEYSVDCETWQDLTLEVATNDTNPCLLIGNWQNIPAEAKADVFVRAVVKAGNATADPRYVNIALQVK